MTLDWLNAVLNWVVAPLGAAVLWLLHRLRHLSAADHRLREAVMVEINALRTDLRVLETKQEAQASYSKASHETLHQQVSAIYEKLNGLERYLREKK